MNFVGFAWMIGKSMEKRQEEHFHAIFIKIWRIKTKTWYKKKKVFKKQKMRFKDIYFTLKDTKIIQNLDKFA